MTGKQGEKLPCFSGMTGISMVCGEADARIVVTQTNEIKNKKQKYRVTVELSDKYDFEKWDDTKKNDFTKFINNYGGYYPQSIGIVKPYNWEVRVTYYIWEEIE